MTTPHPTESFREPPLAERAGTWFIFAATAFIVLGALAIIEPFIAGLAIATLVGWLLVTAGVVHGVAIFRGGGFGNVVWQIVLTVLYLAAGLYFLAHPVIALGSLTVVLAGVLLAEAIIDLVAFFSARGEQGAGWLVVNAVVTCLLAAMIWWQWPSVAIWFIGTLVGVNLIFKGFSWLMVRSAVRSFRQPFAA
jgi:uncharacterized membrane protein HdeD (DUF308 family)